MIKLKKPARDDDAPGSSRIGLGSVLVCVGVLAFAIVRQYLSQGS
jgi:hypothetical protein